MNKKKRGGIRKFPDAAPLMRLQIQQQAYFT